MWIKLKVKVFYKNIECKSMLSVQMAHMWRQKHCLHRNMEAFLASNFCGLLIMGWLLSDRLLCLFLIWAFWELLVFPLRTGSSTKMKRKIRIWRCLKDTCFFIQLWVNFWVSVSRKFSSQSPRSSISKTLLELHDRCKCLTFLPHQDWSLQCMVCG